MPNVGDYITANEVNLCLTIQAFQEALHSQSYSYMLDSICSSQERNDILYQWKNDARLLERNKFIGDLYNDFITHHDGIHLMKTMMANYILEGIYFYSGFMFFYNLGRMGKMPGSDVYKRQLRMMQHKCSSARFSIVKFINSAHIPVSYTHLIRMHRMSEFMCQCTKGIIFSCKVC